MGDKLRKARSFRFSRAVAGNATELNQQKPSSCAESREWERVPITSLPEIRLGENYSQELSQVFKIV